MTAHKRTGEQFLHERDKNLHKSREVEDVAAYLRKGGEKIPNEPSAKIAHYIGFLANKEYANDGMLTGERGSIDRQVDQLIITEEAMPESYFDLQRRIAREQGRGEIEIGPVERALMTETIQDDQRTSLDRWATYLTAPDNLGNYPEWFRKYAFESVTKLGDFKKETDESGHVNGYFKKRTSHTVASYPEVNAEALCYVVDAVQKFQLENRVNLAKGNTYKVTQGSNFGKLYALGLIEAARTSHERGDTNEGSWKKYDSIQGNYAPEYDIDEDDETQYKPGEIVDNPTARTLAESLHGHNTGWCTTGYSTAAHQLSGGDFYVFYSKDAKGKDTIPRIAVRMEDDEVAEVRGVGDNQEMETGMTQVAMDKLNTLPGGESYARKAYNMKRVTDIQALIDEDKELTTEDIIFIHGLQRGVDGVVSSVTIEGFGYEGDDRVTDIRKSRDNGEDLLTVIDYFGVPIEQLMKDACKDFQYGFQSNDLDHSYLGRLISRGLIAKFDYFLQDPNVDNETVLTLLARQPSKLLDLKASARLYDISITNADVFTLIKDSGRFGRLNDVAEKLSEHVAKDTSNDPVFIAKLFQRNGTQLVQNSSQLLEAYKGRDVDELIQQMNMHLKSGGIFPDTTKYIVGFQNLESAGMKSDTAAALFVRTAEYDYRKSFISYARAVKRGDIAEGSDITIDISRNGDKTHVLELGYKELVAALTAVDADFVKFAEENDIRLGSAGDDKERVLRTMMAGSVSRHKLRGYARENGLMDLYTQLTIEKG